MEHGKTTGTERPHDFLTGRWRVHLVYPGERYGLNDCLAHGTGGSSGSEPLTGYYRAHMDWMESYPLVEFYDTAQDEKDFPGGQFTGGRYYLTTLLAETPTLGERASHGGWLPLYGEVPAWTVKGSDLKAVSDWLEETCKAVYGHLPADDEPRRETFGKETYDLAGETLDANRGKAALSPGLGQEPPEKDMHYR